VFCCISNAYANLTNCCYETFVILCYCNNLLQDFTLRNVLKDRSASQEVTGSTITCTNIFLIFGKIIGLANFKVAALNFKFCFCYRFILWIKKKSSSSSSLMVLSEKQDGIILKHFIVCLLNLASISEFKWFKNGMASDLQKYSSAQAAG